MMKRLILLLVLPSFFPALQSQSTFNLPQCIERALEVNIGLKQLDIGLETAEIQYKQALYNFLPSVQGSAGYSQVFGTYFAANGESFKLNNMSSNMGVNASVPIFQGFTLHHRLKGAEIDLKAQGYSIEKTRQDLTNQIVMLYFQIIYNNENLTLSENRIGLLEKQLEQTTMQFDAGRKTEADIFNVKSQIASEKVTLLNYRTLRDKDMLTMRQTLQLDPNLPFTLHKPDVDHVKASRTLPAMDDIYSYAVTNMPQMKERMLKVTSAEYSYKSAKAQLYPNVNFSAGLSDSYTPFASFSNFVITGQQQRTFMEQMQQNLKESINFSLSVPIFERMSRLTSIKTSELSLKNARYDYVQQQNQLLKDIQQAHFDAQAAREKFSAAREQLAATAAAFEYAESKYNAGIIDFYSYLEFLNNKSRSEIDLLNAKYDMIVKSQILDIYQGKPIAFN